MSLNLFFICKAESATFSVLQGTCFLFKEVPSSTFNLVPSSLLHLLFFLSLISLLIVYSHAGGNFLCLNLHLDNTDNWLVHVPCLTKHL